MSAPTTLAKLRPRLDALRAWLTERGVGMIDTTNEWEVLRFKTATGTAVIYRNKHDQLTYSGDSRAAVTAFVCNASWRAGPATKRVKRGTGRNPVFMTLRRRDGNLCFYCQQTVSEKPPAPGMAESIEHLVAVTHGGPNHISNFVLAHRDCNTGAGYLSAMQKVKRHVAAVRSATGSAT